MKTLGKIWLWFLIIGAFWTAPVFNAAAGVQDEIEARNRQIEEIQKQIDEYQRQIEAAGGRAKTLSGEVARLNAQISQVQLEIRSLGLAITQTQTEIGGTQEQIYAAQQKLELQKAALAKYIRITDQADQENLTALLFKSSRLSNFFGNLKNIQDAQSRARSSIVAIRILKTELEEKETELEEKKEELEKLRAFQQVQKRNLDTDKVAKDRLLKETKGLEARYQELVKRSQSDIEKIREQVFYLEQNGVTVEEAVKFGQLAAIRVGIRPAFLLGILEIESGLGRNVGTGNWLTDMYQCYQRLGKPTRAETEKAAFLEIVNKLSLNPDTVKVSREPNYGCGGALGPAQFLPSTWLAYEEEVARLTGRQPPNPWNVEDAFMASAAKLAKGGAGAKTKSAETAAAKIYLSGKSNCASRICNYYAKAVLNKAAAIEQNL